MPILLFHVSSLPWRGEETITLVPGPQGAEGRGVYFSENEPRFSAAEGARLGAEAIFCLPMPANAAGWWRTKPGLARKHGRPKTWHTVGKQIQLSGLRLAGELAGVPIVQAKAWTWEGG